MSSGDGWEGFVAMSKISKMIREEGIKPAVSVSAPTADASDIQWIIGKLGDADVDYDYIGVNIHLRYSYLRNYSLLHFRS